MREITELTPDMVGKRIHCKIKGISIEDAKIQMYKHRYFICHSVGEELRGTRPSNDDLLGYKYSWCVHSGDALSIKSEIVTNIWLLEEPTADNYLILN